MAKVIIIGGGVAGMSAAHELTERGFAVEIYEANPIHHGGKARSEDALGVVPNPLPGEHGFRFFPGFYKHLTHTMKRIPFGSHTCFDNLVPTDTILFARKMMEPLKALAHFPITAGDLNLLFETVTGGATSAGLTSAETNFFKKKIFQLLTSSHQRFNGEYEQQPWWYFVEADRFSANYQNLLADGLTKSLVAAKARQMSTRVGGSIFLQLLYNMADPNLPADRILNGPTNDQWLNPWHSYLIAQGVQFFKNHRATEIRINAGQVQSIKIHDSNTGTDKFPVADYYLLAVPVEQAAKLLSTSAITDLDPILDLPKELATKVSWMNGIQYYLNTDIPVSKGHIIHIQSEWAVTSISQIQFWDPIAYDINGQSGGIVKGILSVDISDWLDTPYKTKLPKDCTDQEIAALAYEQIQQSLIIGGVPVLPTNMNSIVVGYHIASSLKRDPVTLNLDNLEPLLVNTVNSWDLMPKSFTGIPNLFLAGDYVRTNTGLATMEAANESARRAVNCIIDASGTGKPYAKVWKLKEWNMLMPYKWYDKKRYLKGLPYSSHFPWWLHVVATIWAVICLIAWIFSYLFNLVFGFI